LTLPLAVFSTMSSSPKNSDNPEKDDAGSGAEVKADSFFEFKIKNNKGKEVEMNTYKGSVVLVVNVASKCGFTKQYDGLEKLYKDHKDEGLVVLGFPCNQFGGQEPASDEEIEKFCTATFKVDFPLMQKVEVNGDKEHPLYNWLKSKKKSLGMKRIKWNFEKFLINRKGEVVERYSSVTTPDGIEKKIKELLAEKQ